MTQNDGLVFLFGKDTIFSCQHVDLALINAQLTNIGFQEEDKKIWTATNFEKLKAQLRLPPTEKEETQ